MIKAILFDFWGTLVENGVWSPTKQVKEILRVDIPFSEYIVRMERAMMTQNFASLGEAFTAVGAEFGLQLTEEQRDQLVGMWNKSWMLAEPYLRTLETLEHLHKKYRLILVSNTDCFSLPKVIDKFRLSQYFDAIYLSYEKGMLKTDKNFLKMAVDENGLQVQDCIMVGDSEQSDIIPAQRIGMKAVLIDHKNRREVEGKIISLDELEAIL